MWKSTDGKDLLRELYYNDIMLLMLYIVKNFWVET